MSSITLQRSASTIASLSRRVVGRRLKSTTSGFQHDMNKQASGRLSQYVFPKRSNVNSDTVRDKLAKLGAFGLTMAAGQYFLGSAENFFDEKFVTFKRSEDLADFYGTEDFMEIFCIFPFMVDFMMRGAEFDDDGTIHAWGLLGPGELEVTINFEEREVDTDGDGEPDTLAWFNKKEHFRDVAPSFLGGFTLWEMTQNFGYHRYDDGTCVVYHHGENFKGFFPIRLLFQLHAKYVIWATEKYVNSDAFGSEEHEMEREEQRHNIPLHVFKGFLAGLTEDVERAKLEVQPDSAKHDELEATIRRLNTLSDNLETGKAALPRLRTLRSHKTKVSHVHLVMDDEESKRTIQMAMKQIGESPSQRNSASKGMMELNRRTTIATAGKAE